MTIAVILGTRPEIIKMASVIRRPYRKVGMKVLDMATNVAGGGSVTDSQSGFRAYGRRAIESIYIKDSSMSAGSEVILQAKDNDLSIKEVPIHCRYDVKTQNPVSQGFKTLIKILQDMELRRPLYYFTVPGILLAAVGIGMGLDFLRVFYHGGSLAYGPTLLVILLTLVGSFLAMTGIILHSISKMINEFKNGIEQIRKRTMSMAPILGTKPEIIKMGQKRR